MDPSYLEVAAHLLVYFGLFLNIYLLITTMSSCSGVTVLLPSCVCVRVCVV